MKSYWLSKKQIESFDAKTKNLDSINIQSYFNFFTIGIIIFIISLYKDTVSIKFQDEA